MSEETVVAESSAPAVETVASTPEAPETFAIPRSGTPEYESWRKDGSLPTKKEEAAPSQKSESAGESETPQKTQEPKKQTAEERIAQLEATIEKIRKGSEQKKAPVAESAPVKTETKPEYTRPKPTSEDKNADGTPKFNDYEEYIEELADWKAEQREATSKRNAEMESRAKENLSKVEEAKDRYPNFADVVVPAMEKLNDRAVPEIIRDVIDKSKVFADLMYTLSENESDYADFLKLSKDDPREALKKLFLIEELVKEALGKGKSESARNDKGQFQTESAAPVKRGPESAPKPPLEIGQRGTSTMDEAERALQEIGRGNSAKATRAWLDAENRKELARRRG